MSGALTAIALWTIGSAVVAMSLRRLLHSILVLTLAWIGVAAFYLLLGAEFLAFAQALIYLGAISMAVLFAVLLTRRTREEPGALPKVPAGRAAAAVGTGMAVAALILAAVSRARLPESHLPQSVTVGELGRELMGTQAASLLVVAVLLTAALVGAVVLAADDQDGKGDDTP
jgi:NADH-quinone oxidoreductase subunit J